MDRFSQRSNLPRVVFSPCDGNNGMSSGLRGYALAKALRQLGWRTIVIPKQLELSQRERIARLEHPDVVVLQKSRHPLNRPRYFPNSICLFDIDDADFEDPNQRQGVVECMQQSRAVVAGSRYVAEYARKHNSDVNVIWTGSQPNHYQPAKKIAPPVVAWAVSNATGYSSELSLVMSALTKVENKRWQFWLFGVRDAGEAQNVLKPLERRGISCRFFVFMGYRKFLRVLKGVSIGLAPLVPSASEFSAGKSFGKILGYLNCRVAVIASGCADHPLFFRHGENGFLVSSPDEITRKVDLLLSDAALCSRIAAQAHSDYLERLSTQAAARKLDVVLRRLIIS